MPEEVAKLEALLGVPSTSSSSSTSAGPLPPLPCTPTDSSIPHPLQMQGMDHSTCSSQDDDSVEEESKNGTLLRVNTRILASLAYKLTP